MTWRAVFLVSLIACGDDNPRASGAGSGSAAAGSAVAAAPAAARRPSCSLDGSYALRFHSNGTDGWWLYLHVAASEATIDRGAVGMLGLATGPIPIAIDATACSFAIARKTRQAGDLKLSVALDPSTGAVTGRLTRTDDYGAKNEPDTPVTGLRLAAPPKLPACVHPGVFEISTTRKTRWKLVEGHPRFGLSCTNDFAGRAKVRITALGPDLFFDEEGDNGQSFARGTVVRHDDCTLALTYSQEGIELVGAELTLAGDQITGTAAEAKFVFIEDGDAGENMWTCTTRRAHLVGSRTAD